MRWSAVLALMKNLSGLKRMNRTEKCEKKVLNYNFTGTNGNDNPDSVALAFSFLGEKQNNFGLEPSHLLSRLHYCIYIVWYSITM